MFGIGFWEIVIILAIALVALGPEKLPDIARKLGRGMRELREAANGVRRALDEETSDIKSDLKQDLEEIKQPFQQARKPLDEFQEELKRGATAADGAGDDSGPVTPEPAGEGAGAKADEGQGKGES